MKKLFSFLFALFFTVNVLAQNPTIINTSTGLMLNPPERKTGNVTIQVDPASSFWGTFAPTNTAVRVSTLEGRTNNWNFIATYGITNGQSGVTLYSASPMADPVDNTRLVNAGWVRSLLQTGTEFYNSSNINASVSFQGGSAFLYTNALPAAISVRTYSSLTNGQYLGAVVTPTRYSQVSGPVVVDAYLTKGAAGSLTVKPEIYFSSDLTNWWGDYSGASQSITTGTNLYTWVVSFPTATSNTPFYVLRALKVVAATASPSMTISVGGATPSHIMFSSPSMLTIDYATTAGTASNSLATATVPVNIGSLGGSNTLDFATGAYQSALVTNALVLMPPTNGTHGARLEVWLKASGADRTLNFDAAVVRPSDSAASFPKTMTSNLTYIVLLRNSSNVWWLTSLVGGY